MQSYRLKEIETLVYEAKDLLYKDEKYQAQTKLREALDALFQIIYKDQYE